MIDAMLSLPPLPLASMFESFLTSDRQGQAIVLVLLFGSMLTWSIMIVKWREIGIAGRRTDRFVEAYRRERSRPIGVFLKGLKFEPSPLFAVYSVVCKETGAALQARGVDPESLFSHAADAEHRPLEAKSLAAMRSAAERMIADQVLVLESRMSLLATATTIAPLLGLLGTVWGVLNAFGAMSLGGAAMLSKVAPGITGALLTTVIGLLVAIPSSFGYNLLAERIRRLVVRMENYEEELLSDMERHYAP